MNNNRREYQLVLKNMKNIRVLEDCFQMNNNVRLFLNLIAMD